MRRIVSDTGPLISLEKLTDGFRFIRTLYDQIIVPPAVLEEVAFHEDHPGAYLERHGIVDLVEVRAVPEKVKVPVIACTQERFRRSNSHSRWTCPCSSKKLQVGGLLASVESQFQGLPARLPRVGARTACRWQKPVRCWRRWYVISHQ